MKRSIKILMRFYWIFIIRSYRILIFRLINTNNEVVLMIKSSNTKKNILIMGHLLIVILIISTFLLNNPFFFTLLELKREFAEDTTKGYSFFDNNPVYISYSA